MNRCCRGQLQGKSVIFVDLLTSNLNIYDSIVLIGQHCETEHVW